jgi:hypothetical protein
MQKFLFQETQAGPGCRSAKKKEAA